MTTTAEQPAETPKKQLVLHIAVEGFYADDLDEMAGFISEPEPPGAEERLDIVTDEWMRPEVGLTLVSWPGEKEMANDSVVMAYNGRIVGAEARDLK